MDASEQSAEQFPVGRRGDGVGGDGVGGDGVAGDGVGGERVAGDGVAGDGHGQAVEEAALRQLQGLRESIDNVDAALIHMLAERFKFTQVVGRLKAAHGLPAADLEREARQIKRLRALAVEANLDPEFAEKFLNFIVAEVIHHHEKIASDTGAIALPRG